MLPRIEDLLHHLTKPFSIKLSALRPSEFPSIFPKIFPIKLVTFSHFFLLASHLAINEMNLLL